MLLLISPAKTLDYESPLPNSLKNLGPQAPVFPDQTATLIKQLKKLSVTDLSDLMSLSQNLAELNSKRYKDWSAFNTDQNSRPSLFAFNGDVYDGLAAKSLKKPELTWLESHLVILSGLYGVLKPLDALQPYRLEMGTALKVAKSKNLYEFWGTQIAHYLNTRLDSESSRVVINLASQEYFKSVDRKTLDAQVIECVFEDEKNGQYKVISFFAKKARGLMVRFAATQRVKTPEALKDFDLEGYAFEPKASTQLRYVFKRSEQYLKSAPPSV
jgi:cytoplasmic iron level regulating protein YaaA (DUF328/UPF0246 family)